MHPSDPLKFVGSSTEVLALPELFSLVEKASLPTLSVAVQFPDLFDEVAILHRLAYKNKNQHRASKHYQAVCQVLKVFNLFEQLQLSGLLQQLHTAAQRTSLPEAPAAAATNKRARRQPAKPAAAAAAPSSRQAVRLPSFQAGCFVLRRLLSGVQLLLDLHHVIMTAGQHLSGQLSRGYFMPFCLVAAAAVARIRVLATAALLELLQAYNSVVQLLPLLPAATVGSGSSSSSRLQSVDSHGLPQMLQLAWEGPIPALRTIPFEQQGPQSLQGQAAGLQQTFCIASSSNGSPADQLTLTGLAPAAAAAQLAGQLGRAPGLTAGGDVGDVGVAISREAFAQQGAGGQEQQQQQQQKEREEEGFKQLQARQARERAAQLLASRKKQKQRQQQRAIAIDVYEDKKPEGAPAVTAAAAAGGTRALQQEPPAVPLYTKPGLGLSLGDRLNPAPAVPARPRAAVAAAADIIAARAQPQPQLTLHQGGTAAAAPAATATAAAAIPFSTAAAAAAEPDAMEVDTLAVDEQQEYLMLYGEQPTPAQQQQQQQQQPAMQPQQHQQRRQHSVSSAGITAGRTTLAPSGQQPSQPPARKGLQASAALLAMQGQDSSDDFDIVDDVPGPAGAAATAAAAVAGSGGIQALSSDQAVQQLPQQAKPPGLLVNQQQPQQQGQQHAQPQQDSSLQLALQLPRAAAQQTGFAQAAQPAATVSGCQPPLAQTSAGASAGVGAVAAAAAATTEVAAVVGSAVGGGGAAASAPAPPALQAAKRGKQKKRAKQQPPAGQDTDGAASAPRDSILDMLLQGL